LTDTNLRDVYLTRFLNVISRKKSSLFFYLKFNELFILGEPLVLESSTKDIEVNEGDSVTLICNTQGYPTPKIEWQKADARPLSSGHIRQVVSSSLFSVV